MTMTPRADFEPLDLDELQRIRVSIEAAAGAQHVTIDVLRRLISQAEAAYDLSTNGLRCQHGHEAPAALWNCPMCTDPMITIVRGRLKPLLTQATPVGAGLGAHASRNAEIIEAARALCAALPDDPAAQSQ